MMLPVVTKLTQKKPTSIRGAMVCRTEQFGDRSPSAGAIVATTTIAKVPPMKLEMPAEQRQAGLALERHREPVDAGHDAARVRDLHRDGADAVAVLRAVVDARQHDQRGVQGRRVGQQAAAG